MCVKKVKKMMIDKDMSMKALAKKTGYSRTHVSNVIHGHFKAPEARKAISRALGTKPESLWEA